ncbi:hypothetical protein EIP86_006464 [Pleurotus ostreatoroseus]|nr:hypothetical protein EIP86_006464 [Pleurotus ostreatoroseus]
MSAQLDLSDALFTSIVDLSLFAATTSKGLDIQNVAQISDAKLVAWVAYDFLLTLPDEIRYMWTRQVSVVTVLLFLLRYGTLIRQGFLMCTFLKLDVLASASHIW